ncbi:hypothetical protein ACCO45_008846 [Purpureocillium lilacinum]|uniref:Uncharacterized protein n=1 Tax=Purpureocillium lilacinum TaxID=33203 RepID=A0ACC4DKX9_PURLI
MFAGDLVLIQPAAAAAAARRQRPRSESIPCASCATTALTPRRRATGMVLCARRGPNWCAEHEVLVRLKRREDGCGGAEGRHAEATAGSYGWQALIKSHPERHGSEESTNSAR